MEDVVFSKYALMRNMAIDYFNAAMSNDAQRAVIESHAHANQVNRDDDPMVTRQRVIDKLIDISRSVSGDLVVASSIETFKSLMSLPPALPNGKRMLFVDVELLGSIVTVVGTCCDDVDPDWLSNAIYVN